MTWYISNQIRFFFYLCTQLGILGWSFTFYWYPEWVEVKGRIESPLNVQWILVNYPATSIFILYDLYGIPPFQFSVAWFESFIRSVVPLTKLIQPCAARKLLRRFDTSLHVDLQQRSCEFLELLHSEWDPHRPGLLFRKKWVSWICLIKRPSGKDVMEIRRCIGRSTAFVSKL